MLPERMLKILLSDGFTGEIVTENRGDYEVFVNKLAVELNKKMIYEISYLCFCLAVAKKSGFRPICEDGDDKYRGRGYFPLREHGDYLRMQTFLGIPLIANPDLALDPEVATKILVMTVKEGLTLQPSLDKCCIAYELNPYEAKRVIKNKITKEEADKFAQEWSKIYLAFMKTATN